MGNITGAMVFQSCLPTVLGLLFTTWTFTPETAISFASAGVAIVATILIFGNMLRSGRLSAWMLLIGGPAVPLLRLPRPLHAAGSGRNGRPLIPQHDGAERASEGRFTGILLALEKLAATPRATAGKRRTGEEAKC